MADGMVPLLVVATETVDGAGVIPNTKILNLGLKSLSIICLNINLYIKISLK